MSNTTENVNVKIKVEAGEGNKTIRQMRQEMKSLMMQMEEASKAGDTVRFKELESSLANLRNDIKDTSIAMKSLDPGEILSGFTKLAQGAVGSFAAITGAMTLFGGESEKLQEIQKKSMALIQVMMGLEQARQILIDEGGRKELANLFKTTAAQYKKISANLTEALTIKATANASKAATAAQWLWNKAIAANPIGALVVAVAALASGIYLLSTRLTEAEKKQKEFDNTAAKSLAASNAMFESLKNTTAGTVDRTLAIKAINDEYGTYLPNLLTENSSLKDIETAQNLVNDALLENLILKAKQEDMTAILEDELYIRRELVKAGFDMANLDAKKRGMTKKYNEELGIEVNTLTSYSKEIENLLGAYDQLQEKKVASSEEWEKIAASTRKALQVTQVYTGAKKEDNKVTTKATETKEDEYTATEEYIDKLNLLIATINDADHVNSKYYQNIIDFETTKLALDAKFPLEADKKKAEYVNKLAIATMKLQKAQADLDWTKPEEDVTSAYEEMTKALSDYETKRKDALTVGKDLTAAELADMEALRVKIKAVDDAMKEVSITEQDRLETSLRLLQLHAKTLNETSIKSAENQIEILKTQAAKEKAEYKAMYENGELTYEQYNEALIDIDKAYAKDSLQVWSDLMSAKLQKFDSNFLGPAMNALNGFAEVEQAQIEAKNQQYQTSYDNAAALLNQQMLDTEKAYGTDSDKYKALQDSKKKLDEDKQKHDTEIDKKKKAAAKKYAEFQFIVTAAKIVSDTASAIMKAFVDLGPIGGPIAAALIGAAGAAQLVAANSEKQKIQSMGRGGVVNGPAHAQGGVDVNMEGGEGVVNKNSMRIPAFRNMVSAINVAGGGIPFKGANPQTTLTANVDDSSISAIVSQVVQQIAAIPVIVSESDISKTQRRISVLESRTKIG